jgi:hypothetical protein
VSCRTPIGGTPDALPARPGDDAPEKPKREHRPLCTLELIAEGHAERCPGEACAFWERGCVLARVETELDHRPEVAELLLTLRRELEAGRQVTLDEVRERLDPHAGEPFA